MFNLAFRRHGPDVDWLDQLLKAVIEDHLVRPWSWTHTRYTWLSYTIFSCLLFEFCTSVDEIWYNLVHMYKTSKFKMHEILLLPLANSNKYFDYLSIFIFNSFN